MADELISAIDRLTSAVNGVSAILAVILIVLVCKNMNSDSAVRSLRNDVENINATIRDLSSNLCVVLSRKKGGQDDV